MNQPPNPPEDAYSGGQAYGSGAQQPYGSGQQAPYGSGQQPYGPGYGGYPGYARPGYAGAPGVPPADPTLAEWWQRLVARLIDWGGVYIAATIVYYLIAFVIRVIVGIGLAGSADIGVVTGAAVTASIIDRVIGVVLFAGVPFLYEWLMLKTKGQTFGKMAMKIQPVNADTRQPLTDAESAKRAALYPLVSHLACCVFGILDCLWPLWDQPLQQAVHDKLARTVVVKTDLGTGGYGGQYAGYQQGYGSQGYGPQY